MDEALQYLLRHEYPILFLWIFLEQIGLPLPAMPMLIAAGALAGEKKLQLHIAIEIAFAAAILGNLLWYQVGRMRGKSVPALLCRMSITPESCIRRTADLFSRHGGKSLLVAKFIPGLSLMAAPMSGAFRMTVPGFLLYNAIGTLLWVAVFSGIGYLFHDQIERLFQEFLRLGSYLLVLLPGAAGAYFAWKFIQRRRFMRSLDNARITPEELKGKLDRGEALVVLDVRTSNEFKIDPDTVPGAVQFPLDELERRSGEIPLDREIILLCD